MILFWVFLGGYFAGLGTLIFALALGYAAAGDTRLNESFERGKTE